HLQRLTAGQALRLIQARLADFLAPFAAREPIRRRLEADPLFPLGEEWRRPTFQDKVDLRPRHASHWAPGGRRRQHEERAHPGGASWLAGWTGGVAPGDGVEPATEDETRRAVDQAVAGVAAVRAREVREEPHKLPPDADRIAALAYDLLAQCRGPGGPLV